MRHLATVHRPLVPLVQSVSLSRTNFGRFNTSYQPAIPPVPLWRRSPLGLRLDTQSLRRHRATIRGRVRHVVVDPKTQGITHKGGEAPTASRTTAVRTSTGCGKWERGRTPEDGHRGRQRRAWPRGVRARESLCRILRRQPRSPRSIDHQLLLHHGRFSSRSALSGRCEGLVCSLTVLILRSALLLASTVVDNDIPG